MDVVLTSGDATASPPTGPDAAASVVLEEAVAAKTLGQGDGAAWPLAGKNAAAVAFSEDVAAGGAVAGNNLGHKVSILIYRHSR